MAFLSICLKSCSPNGAENVSGFFLSEYNANINIPGRGLAVNFRKKCGEMR